MVVTGVEVAGLVLGAFPILIEGLKFYSDGVSKTKDLRKCAVVIARLDRQIQVEQKKFDQALQLYKEAARDQELDQLFDATVYELKEKLEELKKQLYLDPENKMSELGWKPKDFRKRIVVAIRKDEWKGTLTEISKMIQDLLDLLLIGQQQASPPSRPLKAAAKHYARIRNQAIGLYKALEETLQGLPNATCLSPHCVSLQLDARRAPVESRKYASKQEPPCQVRFKLAIAHEKSQKTTNVEWSEVEVEALVAEESTVAAEVSGDSNAGSTPPKVEPPVSSGAIRATECSPTAPTKSSLGFGFRSKARASLNKLSSEKLQIIRDVPYDRDSDQSDNGFCLKASKTSTSPTSAEYPPPPRAKRTALKSYLGSRFEQTASASEDYTGGRSHSVSSASPRRTGSRPAVLFVSSTSAPIVPTVSVLDERSELHSVIDNLCTTLSSTSAIQNHHCLGMLISGQRKHRIWRNQSNSNTTPVASVVSLDSVLRAFGSDIGQQDWLVLAVRLASTVMQLHTTDWLQDRWRGADILFPLSGNSIDSSVLKRPVITRSLEPSLKTSERKSSYLDMVVQDKTLYSLGIILLELHYGKPLSEIAGDVPEASSDPEVQEHMRARWFVEHLARRTGVRYLNAVRRCIEGLDTDGKPRGLCQDEFKNLVQTQIVSELEEHLKDFSGVKDLSEIL